MEKIGQEYARFATSTMLNTLSLTGIVAGVCRVDEVG